MNFKTFFSEQARKPSGFFGRWVMSKIFDHGNAAINDFMKEQLLLQENDHILEIGFGTGKVIIRQGDFEEATYNDNRFDKICSANTIYFWPQPDNCIKNILRILKPGGKLILAFVDKAQLESRPVSTNVFHFYHRDEIIKLLSCNGFSGSIDMLSKEIKSKRYHCAVAVK